MTDTGPAPTHPVREPDDCKDCDATTMSRTNHPRPSHRYNFESDRRVERRERKRMRPRGPKPAERPACDLAAIVAALEAL